MRLASFGAFLISVSILAITPVIALSQSAPHNPDRKSFNFIAAESEHCLDVSGLEGGKVIKNKCSGARGQGWYVVGIGLNQYQIKSHNNSMCLDVVGASTADGAGLQQMPCGDGSRRNQHWRINQDAAGKVAVVSVNSGKCLEILNNTHINGGVAVQSTCNQEASQTFQLTDIATPVDVDLNPTAIASAAPAGNNQYASPTYTPGSLLPVTGTDSTWGFPNANIKAEVMFETPECTRGEDYCEDARSGHGLTAIANFKGNTYFVFIDANRRPKVVKIDGSGNAIQQFLDPGPDYIQATNGHGRYSIGIDPDGYIHIVGDMHNFTMGTSSYGLDRGGWGTVPYPARYQAINMMYWKSRLPEDINAFDIAGKPDSEWIGKASSPTIPATGWQHGRFFTDLTGTLYVSGRTKGVLNYGGPGTYGFGIYRYDTITKTWSALGALPPIIDSSKQYAKLVFWEHSGITSVGPFFQGFLSNVKFDSQNRLLMAFSTDSYNSPTNDGLVFAMSSNFGTSWTKANGTPIAEQPVRGATGPWQGDYITSGDYNYHAAAYGDQYGLIAVTSGGEWWLWNGSSWNSDQWLKNANQDTIEMASNKSLVMPGGNSLKHTTGFGKELYTFTLSGYRSIDSIDEAALRTTGVAYVLGHTPGYTKQQVLRVTAK